MTPRQRTRLAWLALALVALGLRLWDLGLRTMSHDESLHAFLSFRLATEGAYQHDPVYHGPLLYHLNALVFFLVGASDVTARVAPSLAGVVLVAGLYWWRRYLGAAGAWFAAALVTVSPTLLFYSRHIRNDIYIAVFTLVWAYAFLRYLEERHPRWLLLLTLAMALSFAAKEVSFITGVVIGSFAMLVALRGRGGSEPARAAAAFDLAVLMLALVVPFASGPVFSMLGWPAVGDEVRETLAGAGALVVAGLFALTGAIGAARFGWRQWLPLAAAFWGLQIVLFTTFFTNVSGGLASGIVGSLGYWLTQQEVARAGQPWFYYGVIGLLYEPVTVVVGVAAVAISLWERGRRWLVAAPDDGHQVVLDRPWLPFLAWWIALSWIGYAIAGEKMPWLLVHQVLPLCLAAGWGLSRLVDTGDWERDLGGRLLLVAAAAAAVMMAVSMLRLQPFAGRSVEAVAETAAWWTRVVGLAVVSGVAAMAAARLGRAPARRMVALGLLTPLAVLSVRSSLQLNFVNFDLATEPMSYAQASPDVPRAMREIERLDDRLGGHHQVRVAVDDESSWPFSWYLRDYPRTVAWGKTPALAADADVIVVGARNAAALAPQVARGYVRQRGFLNWWPLQDYASLTPSSLVALVGDPARREGLWQIVMHRRYGVSLAEWPARREFDFYVRNDAAALIGLGTSGPDMALTPARAVETAPWTPLTVVSGPFEGLSLLRPTAVAVAADGARLIADSGHHRVVVLESDGRLRLIIGRGRCALTEAGRPGCLDPDGAGPGAVGDGQFNEPWGVAVAPSGEIAVADTWNGRIQVFDRRGVFLRAFGRFGRVEPGSDDASDPQLFGPRGLAFTADGELVVADTGNNRLLYVALTGERRRAVGPVVDWPPALDEPTGITWDPNGTLLAVDLWNQRVLRLDRDARPLAAWQVPGWQSRDAADKASVTVDAAGRVYAVEPSSGRVFVFSPAGILELQLVPALGTTAGVRPTGIAATGRSLLVVDRDGGRLLELPMPDPPP
ncbi:MAG: TIGR03663 family protein [Acidobacteria bacterium]|nr:TIGR03663 family protein [Acidobacteriota bacterium]